jgi:hypothetical protein
MSNLQRLSQGVKKLLTEEFLNGNKEELEYEEYESYLEGIDNELELEEFDRAIDSVMSETEKHKSEIDPLAAPEIHRTLPLTRREAADGGVWHYLTMVHRPDFVRHRWEYNSRSYMEKRFFGCGEWDTNTLYRLWWAAELTEKNGDYGVTEDIFTRQRLVRAIFDRDLCMYRPAVLACVDALRESSGEVIEETVKRLNRRLTTVQLESASEQDIRDMVLDIRDTVNREL